MIATYCHWMVAPARASEPSLTLSSERGIEPQMSRAPSLRTMEAPMALTMMALVCALRSAQ